jgi:hypothetical protein
MPQSSDSIRTNAQGLAVAIEPDIEGATEDLAVILKYALDGAVLAHQVLKLGALRMHFDAITHYELDLDIAHHDTACRAFSVAR